MHRHYNEPMTITRTHSPVTHLLPERGHTQMKAAHAAVHVLDVAGGIKKAVCTASGNALRCVGTWTPRASTPEHKLTGACRNVLH